MGELAQISDLSTSSLKLENALMHKYCWLLNCQCGADVSFHRCDRHVRVKLTKTCYSSSPCGGIYVVFRLLNTLLVI